MSDALPELTVSRLPRHVAIIMDGNGRWAQQRHLPRTAGHQAGVKSVRAVVEVCRRAGIEVLTLFAFSSENWRRPEAEVSLLFDLFLRALRQEARRLLANDIQLRVIGDRTPFAAKLREGIATVEQQTATNRGMVLQIAANYGGRWDITEAARRLAQRVAAGSLQPEAITPALLAGELSFPDLPEPDLLLRTGGEQRISNFLLWQAAYAELYFTDLMWPEVDTAAFTAILEAFGQRQRRFGRTSEQIREGAS